MDHTGPLWCCPWLPWAPRPGSVQHSCAFLSLDFLLRNLLPSCCWSQADPDRALQEPGQPVQPLHQGQLPVPAGLLLPPLALQELQPQLSQAARGAAPLPCCLPQALTMGSCVATRPRISARGPQVQPQASHPRVQPQATCPAPRGCRILLPAAIGLGRDSRELLPCPPLVPRGSGQGGDSVSSSRSVPREVSGIQAAAPRHRAGQGQLGGFRDATGGFPTLGTAWELWRLFQWQPLLRPGQPGALGVPSELGSCPGGRGIIPQRQHRAQEPCRSIL